ncbi:MAG: 3-deoxy-D-manno-octulosonic acid transferase [Rickettsiales bacterium]
MIYRLYYFITSLLAPLIAFHLENRVKIGKEDPIRYKEKLGLNLAARPQGKLIWFHAASVGELNSVMPLIHLLNKEFPQLNFLVTTGTLNSALIFQKAKLPNTLHQFFPVDIPSAVAGFLKNFKPDMAIFVDSELWPNTITMTAKKCPMLLVNFRMSDNSFRWWRRLAPIAKEMLAKFKFIMSCSQDDHAKLEYFLGKKAKNIEFTGNIKWSAPKFVYDKEEYARFQKSIGKRPFWVAASTHPGEFEVFIRAHQALAKKHKNLLTIVLPRHTERGADIQAICDKAGLSSARRSLKGKITKSTDVYISDVMGELGLCYALADIVFVGGSLIPHGGQNILEPARMGCAIISGTHTFNFKEIIAKLVAGGAIEIVQNEKEFIATLDELLSNKTKCSKLQKAALAVTEETKNILENVTKTMVGFIKKLK